MPLTLRLTKGTELTHQELDDNFTYLDGLISGSSGGGIALTDISVTTGTASGGGSLSYSNTTGQFTFSPADLSSVSGGIALTDLSITTGAASGGGSLSYDSGTGAFTFAPADLSSVSGSTDLTAFSVTTGTASEGGSLSYDSGTGAFTFSPADLSSAGGGITLTDLSVSTGTASGGGSLSYNSSSGAFTFVPADVPSSYTNSLIAPFAFARVANTANGSGTNVSWSNWNSENGTLDFTFSSAQPDTNYTVVTDAETYDDYHVGINSKTVNGFTAEFYDSSGTRAPSSFSPFTLMIYGSTPTQTAALQGGALTLGDLSVTTATASGSGSLSYNNSTGNFTYTPADLSSAGGGIALTDLSVTTATASGSGSLAYSNSTGAFTYTPVDLPNNYSIFTADGSTTGALAPNGSTDIVYFKGGTNVTITAGTSTGTGDLAGASLDSLTFDVDLSSVSGGSSGTTVTGIDSTGTQAVTLTPTLINLDGNSLAFINNTTVTNHYVLTWTVELLCAEGTQGSTLPYYIVIRTGPVGGALSEQQRWNDFIYAPTGVSSLKASRTFTHTVLNLPPNYQAQIWISGPVQSINNPALSVVSAQLSIVEGTQESVNAQTISLLT